MCHVSLYRSNCNRLHLHFNSTLSKSILTTFASVELVPSGDWLQRIQTRVHRRTMYCLGLKSKRIRTLSHRRTHARTHSGVLHSKYKYTLSRVTPLLRNVTRTHMHENTSEPDDGNVSTDVVAALIFVGTATTTPTAAPRTRAEKASAKSSVLPCKRRCGFSVFWPMRWISITRCMETVPTTCAAAPQTRLV